MLRVPRIEFAEKSTVRICSADTPMAYSPTLVDAFLPSEDQIMNKVKEVLYLK